MSGAEAYWIDPAVLATGGAGAAMPIAFVALEETVVRSIPAPPFPVIGLGDPAHPLAASLDAVIESPVSARALVEQVTRHPLAAGVIVQLLRATEALAVTDALALESIAYAMLQGSADHAGWIAGRAPEMPMASGRVLVARDEARLRIVLDRPAARNAIDRPMRDALHEAFTLAALDPAIGRVELRATGPAFSVGADLAEFGTTRDPATAHHLRTRTLPAHPLSRCAAKLQVHVQGACVGAGLELAAFAGRVTAAPSAWFQLPELAMGVLPGAGGCVSVPRRIGRSRATLMMLSGRRIDAATALRWGLVDAIVDELAADPGRADADRG